MPISKNAYIRYREIDRCLNNKGKKYSKKDLLNSVNEALEKVDSNTGGINDRQLGYDLQFMRSEDGFSAPIVCFNEGPKYFYRYTDDYTLESKPLNKLETNQLMGAKNNTAILSYALLCLGDSKSITCSN